MVTSEQVQPLLFELLNVIKSKKNKTKNTQGSKAMQSDISFYIMLGGPRKDRLFVLQGELTGSLFRSRYLNSGLVLCSWAVHCTLSPSLNPGVEIGTGKLITMDYHPIQRESAPSVQICVWSTVKLFSFKRFKYSNNISY